MWIRKSWYVRCSVRGNGCRWQRLRTPRLGTRKFIHWATKGGRPARVCLEATGFYGLELALALHRTKNVEVMVVNPGAIKDFSRACMRRAKTDAVDAGGILDYLERMPFPAWQPPSPEILELQAITRRIEQLNTELTREKKSPPKKLGGKESI